MNETSIKKNLISCYKIYNEYSWLLNSYVLDFFTENHWSKLSQNWQVFFDGLQPENVANLLELKQSLNDRVWPLSIIALRILLKQNCINRKLQSLQIDRPTFFHNEKLLTLFWKNVKIKKRHEISIISRICYKSAQETNCFYIVDIGSGLGHLSRMLNYGYNFKVCTIEAKKTLTDQAKKLDREFENLLKKYKVQLINNVTVHVNMKINSNISATKFLHIVKQVFQLNNNDFMFGIVGLHTCGDLGATLLRLYKNCENCQFINIVGCCYMKLSPLNSPNPGFPLSDFCSSNKYDLSYHSKEIACHAIENYIEKLNIGEISGLKIHTYRALIEKILISIEPSLRHSSLNNVKYTEGLTFKSYCEKAVGKLKITIPDEKIDNNEISEAISQWPRVVVFYSLRLLLAPLIETIILLDRKLFLSETKSDCDLIPIFDARISPRNHVLTAKKNC